MQKRVSVIIPTYNLKDDLLDCLDSIFKSDYKNLEVIVIDNASVDGTADAVKKKFPKVKLIINPRNLGVTGGANAGVKVAKGEYLLFIDHDNILKKDMLTKLVELMESDLKIGIAVGKIYFDEDHTVIWAAGTGINLWTGQIYFRTGKDKGQFDKVEDVQVAPANFLVRRDILIKDGVYDSTYVINYEDTDLSFRCRKMGFRCVYTPDAVTYHRIPMNPEGANKRVLSRGYWIGRNRVIFMRRWGHFLPFVMIFLPALSLYYLYIAIRYNQLQNYLFKYLKGTYDGLTHSSKDKTIPTV